MTYDTYAAKSPVCGSVGLLHVRSRDSCVGFDSHHASIYSSYILITLLRRGMHRDCSTWSHRAPGWKLMCCRLLGVIHGQEILEMEPVMENMREGKDERRTTKDAPAKAYK
eukprot:GHVU01188533.1.p1 GENE.GHVU01188533.1~~GHVU01188533.1.p1  ORF type:complete len:111 (-),score=4.52 GHVU01188533.1:399-731(-)